MGEFLPTLQAAAVTIDEQRRDIYGLELYALRKNGIYSGIQQEANVDLGAQPLYLGVAYEIVDGENGKLMKAFNQDKHATASCSIPSTIRYVDCPTVYKDACATEKTLFDATRTMTGPFAEFVVIGSSGTDANDGTATITVVGADAAAAKYTFPSLTVPVGTGYLTVGLHLAEQH